MELEEFITKMKNYDAKEHWKRLRELGIKISEEDVMQQLKIKPYEYAYNKQKTKRVK